MCALKQGFILDGFPQNAHQAALMESALIGLDLENELLMRNSASVLAPPPKSLLPDPDRLLSSGHCVHPDPHCLSRDFYTLRRPFT